MARTSRLVAVGIAVVLCLDATPLAAQGTEDDVARVIDAFNPYATVGFGYDSNIYRLDDRVDPIGDERADQYAMVSAGFDADIARSLQRWDLYGEVSHTLFNEHDELDYTGSRAGAIWHWGLTKASFGSVGFTHRRALRDFANQPPVNKVKDLRMENKLAGDANIKLPGRWTMGVRGEFADVTFSETDRLDLRRFLTGGNVGYASTAGSTIGLDAEYLEGDYDENPLADYEEYTVGPTLDWNITERTVLEAKVGYTNRNQADPLRQDYDGVTGRATVSFNNDPLNALRVVLYRDLSNLGDEVLEFAEVTGVEVEPRWQLREGMDVRFVLGYEKRDFNPDPDAELIGLDPNRDDDVFTGGAFLDWQYTRNFKLSVGADMQKHDSTRELEDFDFHRFEIKLTGSL
jgi:Putative beta-barrel porin 2